MLRDAGVDRGLQLTNPGFVLRLSLAHLMAPPFHHRATDKPHDCFDKVTQTGTLHKFMRSGCARCFLGDVPPIGRPECWAP